MEISTPTGWAAAILEVLAEQGHDTDTIVQTLGIDEGLLSDRNKTMAQDTVTALWDCAVQLTGNSDIGFEVGKRIHTVLNPLVAYSLMSCSNLKQSCDRLLRYQDIVAEGLQFEIREFNGQFELVFEILPSSLAPSPQAIKSAIAAFFSFVRWITQNSIQAVAATLKQERPVDTAVYDELFACPIQYSEAENCLYFRQEDLFKPLPTADATLSEVHEQHLQSYRQQYSSTAFSRQVRTLIEEQLPSGEPAQQDLAKLLGVSVSTLKRRLNTEGMNFSALMDNTRHQLALVHLKDKSLSLTDITYLLGFSQSSAFTRAFKRWEGSSPGSFRARPV